MKKILTAAVCVLLSASVHAEDNKDKKPEAPNAAVQALAAKPNAPSKLSTKEDAKRLFDDTMNFFVTDRVSDAFAMLKPVFPLDQREMDLIQGDIQKKRVLMKQRFGNSIGFVYLGQDALSDVFTRFIYVEKFERHAIRWLFVVYKPRDVWIVNAVSFDDKLDEHFKAAS